jgi:hypothetical protein
MQVPADEYSSYSLFQQQTWRRCKSLCKYLIYVTEICTLGSSVQNKQSGEAYRNISSLMLQLGSADGIYSIYSIDRHASSQINCQYRRRNFQSILCTILAPDYLDSNICFSDRLPLSRVSRKYTSVCI